MLNKSYQYYPTGYRTPLLPDQVKGDIVPDAELLTMWQLLSRDRAVYDSFEFKDQVLVRVKALFGNFAEWLDAQDANPKITSQAYELIKDTINYINTGRRDVMIISRTSLVAQQYSDGIFDDPKVTLRKTRLRELLQVPTSEVFYHWLKHRDGFEDMLCTSIFLFGTELRK